MNPLPPPLAISVRHDLNRDRHHFQGWMIHLLVEVLDVDGEPGHRVRIILNMNTELRIWSESTTQIPRWEKGSRKLYINTQSIQLYTYANNIFYAICSLFLPVFFFIFPFLFFLYISISFIVFLSLVIICKKKALLMISSIYTHTHTLTTNLVVPGDDLEVGGVAPDLLHGSVDVARGGVNLNIFSYFRHSQVKTSDLPC